MSDPRPMPVRRLAARLHLPVSDVRQAAYNLGAHWGLDRVVTSYDDEDGMAVTPAAIVAIRQHFGIGDIPQLRGHKPHCKHTTPSTAAEETSR